MHKKRDVDPPTGRTPDDLMSDPVDEASFLSFPASDPPAWIVMHPGPPAPAAGPAPEPGAPPHPKRTKSSGT